MSIRKKIFLGCTVVAFILLLAGVTIAFEMQRIRSSVSLVVAENVKSMNAAYNMQRLFYGQNMILLDYGSTKNDSVLNTLNAYIAGCEEAYKEAQNRISIKGEQQVLDSLNTRYSEYKKIANNVIRLAKTDRRNLYLQYCDELYKSYENVSQLIDRLFLLNQKEVEGNSVLMNANYYRMIMPAIIAILTCIVLIFLLNYFIYIYFISPMVRIVKGVNAFNETRVPYNISVDTKDEILALNNEIKKLTELTKKYEKEN
ncbi:MAG: MCP four helix bundle domain-containing protein [Prevotellaceae bacterium]|jgi:methyl-accepting chemotaxis protein|nr:MCP four helix bundle domain-containing protein [Prevotellaceae bacterium]